MKPHSRYIGELYEQHFDSLDRLLASMRFSREDREDLIHDLVVKISRRDEVPDLDGIKSYLVFSLKNLAIDRIRKEKCLRSHRDLCARAPSGPKADEGETIVRELMDRALQEISSLPGGDDFAAFYLEGKRIREIAASSGRPSSTVASSIFRHRKKYQGQLRQRIESEMPIYHQCLE